MGNCVQSCDIATFETRVFPIILVPAAVIMSVRSRFFSIPFLNTIVLVENLPRIPMDLENVIGRLKTSTDCKIEYPLPFIPCFARFSRFSRFSQRPFFLSSLLLFRRDFSTSGNPNRVLFCWSRKQHTNSPYIRIHPIVSNR